VWFDKNFGIWYILPYGKNGRGAKILREQQVIESVLRRFEELLPELTLKAHREIAHRTGVADLVLDVQIGDVSRKLVCEVKGVGEPRYLRSAITQLTEALATYPDASPVIIAPYISREGRKLCRDHQVGYIDLTGNIFLRFNHVLIDKSGEGPPPSVKRKYRRLFTPVASRVIRVMLENPERSWTMMRLSAESEVSAYTVYRVFEWLDERGYIEKARGATSLLKPGYLLDLWAENYDFSVNPSRSYYSLAKGFRAFGRQLKELKLPESQRYALTMHSGASLVAPFVRFSDIHLYFEGDPETIVQALDLRPVESGGQVHILTPYDKGVFYNSRRLQDLTVVCNTQLYLDLINYPARGEEQARFLREQEMPF